MADIWLPGFEIIPNDHSGGGTYVDGAPWRFVGHTTEVVPSSLAGARGLAARHDNPPHLWAWPEKHWKAQTVPLNRSAFALLHKRGTQETNKMRAIQVEVVGLAQDMASKPEAFWDWLGEEILAAVVRAGIPINLRHVAPTTGSDGAGVDGKVRMSETAWHSFDGVCVHANVPNNEHWDMGHAPTAHMAAAAARVLNPPTTEDSMIRLAIITGEPTAPGDQADTFAVYRVVSHATPAGGRIDYEAHYVEEEDQLDFWKSLLGPIDKTQISAGAAQLMYVHGGPFKNV